MLLWTPGYRFKITCSLLVTVWPHRQSNLSLDVIHTRWHVTAGKAPSFRFLMLTCVYWLTVMAYWDSWWNWSTKYISVCSSQMSAWKRSIDTFSGINALVKFVNYIHKQVFQRIYNDKLWSYLWTSLTDDASVLVLSAPLGAPGCHHHRPAAAAAGGTAWCRHWDAPGRSLQPPVPNGEISVLSGVCMKYPQRLQTLSAFTVLLMVLAS